MSNSSALELTIQDLPTEITLDLTDMGGEQGYDKAVDSLKAEIRYNSRFFDEEAEINVSAIEHKGNIYKLSIQRS